MASWLDRPIERARVKQRAPGLAKCAYCGNLLAPYTVGAQFCSVRCFRRGEPASHEPYKLGIRRAAEARRHKRENAAALAEQIAVTAKKRQVPWVRQNKVQRNKRKLNALSRRFNAAALPRKVKQDCRRLNSLSCRLEFILKRKVWRDRRRLNVLSCRLYKFVRQDRRRLLSSRLKLNRKVQHDWRRLIALSGRLFKFSPELKAAALPRKVKQEWRKVNWLSRRLSKFSPECVQWRLTQEQHRNEKARARSERERERQEEQRINHHRMSDAKAAALATLREMGILNERYELEVGALARCVVGEFENGITNMTAASAPAANKQGNNRHD